jgi:tRNA pseudouridine38-40 synthase
MTRYKLTLEYDGGPFVGWQRQDNGPSVQAALENAAFAFCAERVTAFGAGRTDAGVHSLGQVAHLDIAKEADVDTVRDALNFHLKPSPISILRVEETDEEFDARFSAKKRRYSYRILNRRSPATIDRGHVWEFPQALDADAMHQAAQTLVGRHDFSTFRATRCQAKSPVKTLDELSVSRAGEEVNVSAAARSFLHHQVRSFVGTLVQVGIGKWTREDVQSALASKDRARCGPIAPACGLYLTRVDY